MAIGPIDGANPTDSNRLSAAIGPCASVLAEPSVVGPGGTVKCADAALGKPPQQMHALRSTWLLAHAAPALVLEQRKPLPHCRTGRPVFSLVMPVHNGAVQLRSSLLKLLRHTVGCGELLVLLDCCSDDSFETLTELLRSGFWSADGLLRARVWNGSAPIWEAGSENLLMSISAPSSHYISVQPDQILEGRGWNERLARPLVLFPDVLGVGARCASPFALLDSQAGAKRLRPPAEMWRREAAKGDPVKLARYVAPGAPPSKPCASDPIVSSAPDTYFIRDTCDRGPLLLAAAKAQALRFFDDEIFWMEGSEHDLFCRGQRHGWVTGVVNIPVNSPWQLKAQRVGHGAGTIAGSTKQSSAAKALTAEALQRRRQWRVQILTGRAGNASRQGCLDASRELIVAAWPYGHMENRSLETIK